MEQDDSIYTPEAEAAEDEAPRIVDIGDGRELYEHFRFVADKGQELLRVDKFLALRLQKSSRNRVQQAAQAGCIIVNGRAVKSNYRVKPLDVVQVVMDRPRYDFEVIAEDIPLDIVYEDDTVLVVNKPAGLVVHPGHGNYSGTLVNALAWHFRDTPDYDVSDPRLGLVHRIDKDTSGLLVVAKTPDAKTHLGRQFFNKTTRREYIALVWGVPDPPKGRIEGNIGRNERDRLQMAVYPPGDERGKHAVTHYEVVEPLGHVAVVRARDRTHPSDTCAHEAHRPHAVQRLALRRRRASARTALGIVQCFRGQLFRRMSAPGAACPHPRIRASGHRRGDVLHLRDSGRHGGSD